MNKIKANLNVLNKEFENLKVETEKEKILSSKIHKHLLKIQNKINQTHQQLDKLGNRSKLKNVAVVHELKTELANLKLNVHFFQLKLPTHFKAKETRNFLKKQIDSFFGLIFNTLNYPVRKAIFSKATLKKIRPTLSQKLNQLQNQQSKIEKKILLLNKKLSLCKNPKRKKSFEKKIEFLNLKIKDLYFKIKPLQKKIHRHEACDAKSDMLRQSARTLGGERVTLTTSDHVNLDGLFLDALEFRKNLSKIGCNHTTLTQDNLKINALVLSKENYLNNGAELMDALKLFHAFAEPKEHDLRNIRAGWQIVYHENQVYIISDHQLPKNRSKEHPLFKFNSELEQWEIKQDASQLNIGFPESIDIESPAKSTVIISSGSTGIYEMNKTEAMFYLIQNMNVMLFNFRGHNLSQGTPTKTGLKLDMECAYQFVKQRSKHHDKQILFKALCLSSYIASYIAAKHPETNIIIDQTYSSFKTLFKETAQKKLKKWFSSDSKITKKMIKILSSLASLFAPNINTSKYFSKIRGKKAIFYSAQDEFVGIKHVEENMKAVFKAKQGHQLFVAAIPGKHATSIVSAKGRSKDFFPVENQKLIKKCSDLLKISMALKNEINKEIDLNKKEEKQKELEKMMIQIELALDERHHFDMANSLFYSQLQLGFFLKKAELSDSIIKN
ncbi:MAG: hypothetical protein Q8K60_09530 [Parachlamydiaceae bacterium]|nr:hypothetical protein [Parachlamydiaceae bacterium]